MLSRKAPARFSVMVSGEDPVVKYQSTQPYMYMYIMANQLLKYSIRTHIDIIIPNSILTVHIVAL